VTLPVSDDSDKSKEQLLEEIRSLRAEMLTDAPGAIENQTQARLAAIVESSDDAIVSKSLDGIIRTWNKGAQRIFGYTPEEVIGKHISILIPPDRQDEEPRIIQTLQQGRRVDHYETIRVTKTGQHIYISATISPIRDSTGKIVGASKIARDITLQKQVEEELRAAKELAEAASKAKDHFLSILSHELRTPLTPVLAEMSYLETKHDLSPELREHVAMVRRNIETEARLVDDLLDLTRISRGKVELRPEVVDIHDAIHGTLTMLKGNVEAKSLSVTIALRGKQHHVRADPGRLQQVLLNLLSNAVKFTPENGSITIRSSDVDGKVRVEMTDTGIGIEPDLLPLLFQAFKQGERTRQFGGLGLGLSISKSLIDMHGGTLTAASEGVDRGATFTLELTAVPAPVAASVSPGKDAVAKLGWRVLLVEDHEDTRRVMERLLQSLGCTVASAGSVREAVKMAEGANFDLMISDIGLPDGTGMDAMVQINRIKKLRGIALSGYGQDDDLKRSREAGFETHLTKPVNFDTLRETINRVAGGPA
jgi:PAS domain S-box-containing protein